MTIALDANLGDNNSDGTTATIVLTTTSAVAAGGFIVVGITWNDNAGALSSVDGGSLTWAIDAEVQGTGAGGQFNNVAIASAQAPAGLASSTAITANFSPNCGAKIIGGNSFTGVKTSSPVESVGTQNTSDSTPNWSSNAITLSDGSLIYVVSFARDTETGNTPTAPALEAWDRPSVGNAYGSCAEYRILVTGGSISLAGAYGANATQTNVGVAYLAEADEPPAGDVTRSRLIHSRMTSW